ncbi:GNAT family N-acetyltransferase [Enterococcus sp. UD-01]|jgi:riboflavin biosynthesis RibT protein|uniref:GNAT family N-acetyltransferase n=1 Tax=Enterococcus sp. UD-01 TaxID=3373911 RepID=UPI003837EFF6
MLKHYRKEQRKIAMGLLSFHQKLAEYQSLLKEIDMYETEENLKLLFWIPEGENNIQGIVGLEFDTPETMILHDITINPSYRGEKLGFNLLQEVADKYADRQLYGTQATAAFLSKWKDNQ